MNNTAPHPTHEPPQSAIPRPIAARRRGSASHDRPTWGETLLATAPIVGSPAFFGPPIIFVLGPWLLLVLLLIPPAAFLITLVLVAIATAGLLVALGALVASPYLLVHHLRTRHASQRRRFALVRRRVAPGAGVRGPNPGRSGWLPAPVAGGPSARVR